MVKFAIIAIAAMQVASIPVSGATNVRRLKGSKAYYGSSNGNRVEYYGSKASKGSSKEPKQSSVPEIGSLMDKAFPMWEVYSNGNRVEVKECSASSCEWNPYYLTKRYDGLHPDFGGHPTDIDTGYPFYYPSPFGGQPYGGSPHHCSKDINDFDISKCPKIKTYDDSGPQGPGHVPPHISLASLTWAVDDNLMSLEEMFNYDIHQCRAIPDKLLMMVRHYYPRQEDGSVDYPPPFTPEGGNFMYEFSSGRGLDNMEPPYEPGPPHWCSDEFIATGNWKDFCPYVYKGPDAGKYRHPHIALAALEVYLSNMVMPDKCSTTWLENNPSFLETGRVTTNIAFPKLDKDHKDIKSIEHWAGQPRLPLNYDPTTETKAAEGTYVNSIYFS